MTYQILLSGKHRVLEWRGELRDASQAAELISACIGEDCARLLIPREALPEAFFQLSSRFAGEFLQQLQNYRLRTAVVIDAQRDYGERFGEFLREAKRGRYSRLFLERDEAMDWLVTC
ncbi:DUF4180 domain-containing protein [Chromobacterium violaceum]|uniref:DUF4180 domain-containing protein n=1 Tax=Chromobacterium violaceum TaxID=536 RepID=UPI0009DB21D8|nr:DUF4180 domain-containing protein [Chromobacterium violaceum]OQS50959.1 hypothetical protein B0T48_00075 [Chromobacterium violaceum]OQS52960.1 hypothetical protein B0T49_00075 [Chromobacterium violaceum]QRO34770.1 DUF4180 domain-containing protein [Chromobacterium violaceum]QRQ15425.1 DUF4180 domain-containing protein [Chromobacterium violaceum]